MKLLCACLAACLLWIAAAPTTAHALEVRQTLWGFDGQVVPGTFNPLSVLVVNRSPVPFDGQLQLMPGLSMGPQSGGVFAAPCYLAPGTSRWVQFYPYFHNEYNPGASGLTLVWGSGPNSRYDLDSPTLAAPARVWFDDPSAVSTSSEAARLKHFPDDLFPPTVAAADGLNAVVLDHVPRWEAARRAAFLDWLRRGGTLHLLPDATGREPVFTEELALLNSPLDTLRVGDGRVIHHHGSPGDLLHDNALLAADPPAPKLEKAGQPITVYDLDDTFFENLNRLTRARVRWTLLYALTALYLLAVGPGHYFWARRQRDYRLSLLALTGGVAIFAFLFSYFGRRGSSEQGKVLTIACARALDGNRYDVTQWSNVFVTSGKVYTLTHPSEYNLYSSGTTSESTAGIAASGRGGGFHVDLPLFSSCAVTHRGVMTGDDTAVLPARWKTGPDGKTLEEIQFTLPPGFPEARFRSAWLRCGDNFYALHVSAGALVLAGKATSTDTFLSAQELSSGVNTYWGDHDGPPVPSEVFERCQRVLIANSLGGNEHFPHYISRPTPPGDQAELFLFLNDSPETFRLRGAGNLAEPSLVMYQRTVFQPQAP